ncbi:MAG: YlxR family protein [Eubacteriales bacterium]|jgi:predicted RNA-binding protein YlxR (DUF448 family)|nr:YlxR family protein [Eubacteriales bacterium]
MKHRIYDSKGKKVPVRMCASCMGRFEKKDLVRIVKLADGNIVVCNDEPSSKRTFGRGAYICKNKDCILKAQKTHALERSFKGKVPKEIYEVLLELDE